MKKTTLYLPDDLVVEIETMSKQQLRPEEDIIREALASYLANRRRPLPSFVGMASDGSIHGKDVEAYLEEHWKPDW